VLGVNRQVQGNVLCAVLPLINALPNTKISALPLGQACGDAPGASTWGWAPLTTRDTPEQSAKNEYK